MGRWSRPTSPPRGPGLGSRDAGCRSHPRTAIPDWRRMSRVLGARNRLTTRNAAAPGVSSLRFRCPDDLRPRAPEAGRRVLRVEGQLRLDEEPRGQACWRGDRQPGIGAHPEAAEVGEGTSLHSDGPVGRQTLGKESLEGIEGSRSSAGGVSLFISVPLLVEHYYKVEQERGSIPYVPHVMVMFHNNETGIIGGTWTLCPTRCRTASSCPGSNPSRLTSLPRYLCVDGIGSLWV